MLWLTFCFLERNTLKNVGFSCNMSARLTLVCRIYWWCFFIAFSDWKYLYWSYLVQNIKIITLSLRFIPTIRFMIFCEYLMVD